MCQSQSAESLPMAVLSQDALSLSGIADAARALLSRYAAQEAGMPEWYISGLMMDRALDASCGARRRSIGGTTSRIAGYSRNGKIIYIDRHMPETMRYGGRNIDTDRYLILHEEVEKTLNDQLGLQYLHAHQIASRAEQAAVRAAGIRWPTTTASCRNTSSASATSG